jgi:hypothetical protein
MYRAIGTATALVELGEYFVVTLYRYTPKRSFWTREKKFSAKVGPLAQALARGDYKSSWIANNALSGSNLIYPIREYKSGGLGMDWSHDAHDRLGGYPYGSAAPDEVARVLTH